MMSFQRSFESCSATASVRSMSAERSCETMRSRWPWSARASRQSTAKGVAEEIALGTRRARRHHCERACARNRHGGASGRASCRRAHHRRARIRARRDLPAGESALAARIEASGAVISQFEPGTPPLPHHFPLRNRGDRRTRPCGGRGGSGRAERSADHGAARRRLRTRSDGCAWARELALEPWRSRTDSGRRLARGEMGGRGRRPA